MANRAASDRSSEVADAAIAAAVAAVCFALYVATLTPALSFLKSDSHELTVAAATLGLPHPSGYPLYTWLAYLVTKVPVGEIAYRTNLFSSAAGAAAAGILFLLGRATGLPRAPAAFAALLFGFSTTFWSQAVITEVYAPNACAVLVTVWLLVRWASTGNTRLLVGTALASGLSLGTHMANVAYAPILALFVLLQAPGVLRRPALLAGLAAAWFVGAAQYAWLPLRAEVLDVFPSPTPNTWDTFVAYVFGSFRYAGEGRPLAAQPGQLEFFADEVVRNFTSAGVVLGALGMWRLAWLAPRTFWLVGGVFAVNVVTALQPRVMDLNVLLIPGHAMFALFCGFGVEGASRAIAAVLSPSAGGTMTSRVAYGAGAAVLAMALAAVARANYARNDRSGDTFVGDFQRAVFAGVPIGSRIVGGRGAFGRDLVYARLTNDASRHFVLPSVDQPGPLPARRKVATVRRPLYVVTRMIDRSLDVRRWTLAPTPMPRNAWTTARIAGGSSGLILYRVTASAPDVLTSRTDGGDPVEPTVGGPLRAHAVEPTTTADGRIRLATYWATDVPEAPVVTLRLRGEVLEAHEVGYGSWARTLGRGRSTPTALFVERVDVVVPSSVPAGTHALDLGIVDLGPNGPSIRWIPLGDVSVG